MRRHLLLCLALTSCIQDWSRPWRDAAVDLAVRPDLAPLSRWVTIPCGRYLMGSPSSEPCRASGESLHEVLLTRRFEIMRSEVGRGELAQATGHRPASTCETDACPASSVSWHQAAAYCNALSSKAGLPTCYACKGEVCERRGELAGSAIHGCRGYRLPTEAEWEWSYRAGSTTALYSGPLDVCTGTSAAADPIAWYAANASGRLHPRGTRQSNAWGLHDLAGNALEWTHDGRASPIDAVEPVGPDAGEATRAMRGGSFRDAPGALRGAASRVAPPALHTDETGFRCVRTLPVAQQSLLSGLALPSKPGEYAVDLDGTPKNSLGDLLALVKQVGIDLRVDQLLATGKMLLAFELGGSSLEEQASAALQSFAATDPDQDPSNNFTGSAVIAIDRKTPTEGVLEGPLLAGRLRASGRVLVPVPVPVGDDPTIPLLLLPVAKVDLTFSPSGAKGVLGGAITSDQLEREILPLVAGAFNWILDPANEGVDPTRKQIVRDTLDANHDGAITIPELKDSIVGRALVPDIDLDQDGKADSYSVGVGVTFTACTIVR